MGDRSKKINQTIGTQIKSLREKANFTQEELSRKLFKSPSTVRMWELGKSEPDNETILLLSKIFNVTTDYLLGKEPAPEDEDNTVTYFYRGKRAEKVQLPKEDMDVLIAMVEAMKNKNKDKE